MGSKKKAPFDGFLVVDKPTGISSFDVIRRLRPVLKTGRVGHTGTLDPAASGVLILCVGWCTKFAGMLIADDKEYITTMRLGVETDTHDSDGVVVSEREIPALTEADIERVLAEFRGELEQVPPQHSAVHVNGERAYALARRGEEVALEARTVHVRALELIQHKGNELTLRCDVSKGTYIRSLARDIGRALGCGAHLISLRRSRSGDVPISSAVPLQALKEMSCEEAAAMCRPPAWAVRDWPAIDLNDELVARFRNGQRLRTGTFGKFGEPMPGLPTDDGTRAWIAVRAEASGDFVGLAQLRDVVDDAGLEWRVIAPKRVYPPEPPPLQELVGSTLNCKSDPKTGSGRLSKG